MKSKEYDKYIKELLETNITARDLAKKYNLSEYALYNQIQKRNIKIMKNYGKEINYVRSKKDELIKLYEPGFTSLAYLAKKIGAKDYHLISQVLKENGIDFIESKFVCDIDKIKEATEYYLANDISIVDCARKNGVGKNSLRKYINLKGLQKKQLNYQKDIAYNKHYFDYIDNEHKAYWLGFIMADGYTKQDRGIISQFTIEISEEDIILLEKFKEDIESNHIIKKRTRVRDTGYVSHLCSITFSSQHIAQTIAKYGVIPNKTYYGYINENIFNNDEKLIIPYLRGYIDGDGHINPKKGNYVLKIVIHSKDILDTINNWLIQYFDVEPVITTYQGTYRLSVQNKKDYFKVLDKIYENSTIHLDRKYKAYLFHKEAVSEEK